MAEYHLGNSPITNTIYAGTLNKAGTMWRNKSDVTEEALACVRDHLFQLANDTGGFSHEYIGAKSKWCPECGAKMDKEADNGTA